MFTQVEYMFTRVEYPKSQHRDRTHARTDTQRQTHQAQDTADLWSSSGLRYMYRSWVPDMHGKRTSELKGSAPSPTPEAWPIQC